MIIGVSLGMIPYNGDSILGKIGIVATAYGIVPRTIIRNKGEAIYCHIIFQPIAKNRM